MYEELKNALPNPMENYRAIAKRVEELRGKPISWRSVMYLLGGRNVEMAEETKQFIKDATLEVIANATKENLILLDSHNIQVKVPA